MHVFGVCSLPLEDGSDFGGGIAVPGFHVHITGSSIVGVGYAAAAWYVGGMPPVTCLLGGGVCAVAGMMPDLDSGPGIPMRECVAFAAAVVPMMLLHRFHQMGLPMEATIIVGAAIYAAIRFGVTWLLKHYAVHRGMFHSLPSAAIAGPVLRPNIVTYVLAIALGLIAANDAAWTERMSLVRQQMEQAARPYPNTPAPGYYRR